MGAQPGEEEATAGEAAAGQRILGRLVFPALVVAYLAAFGWSTRELSFEARGFPRIIGGLALLVTLSIVVSEVGAWRKERFRKPVSQGGWSAAHVWRVGRAGTLAILFTALLVPLSTHLGFFTVLPVFLIALLLVLGVRPWWAALLTASAYTAVTYLFFDVLMGLRLPTG